MTETDIFKHSTPLLYHRLMGPLLFEPYAKQVAVGIASSLLLERVQHEHLIGETNRLHQTERISAVSSDHLT
jgi:hypothetical protein